MGWWLFGACARRGGEGRDGERDGDKNVQWCFQHPRRGLKVRFSIIIMSGFAADVVVVVVVVASTAASWATVGRAEMRQFCIPRARTREVVRRAVFMVFCFFTFCRFGRGMGRILQM